MNTDLYPSLWRTFRVLANPARLRVLQALHQAAPQAVSVVAKQQRVSMSQATQILRALQARGLLRAQRRGAWVFYAPAANPSIAYSPALAAALQQALAAAGRDLRPLIADLTAYTHERRIRLVRAASIAGVIARADLGAACQICAQSLGRHVDKLSRRGVFAEDDGQIRLCSPRSPLAAALLQLVLADRPTTA